MVYINEFCNPIRNLTIRTNEGGIYDFHNAKLKSVELGGDCANAIFSIGVDSEFDLEMPLSELISQMKMTLFLPQMSLASLEESGHWMKKK